MRIDLHTHSLASDGTQTPRELVEAAAAAGLDVVALTDHDTSDGWSEATAAAEQVGVELVRGMELSTKHKGRGVHLLAYLPDPDEPHLRAALERIVAGRDDRVPGMLDQLRALGIDVDLDDVRRANPGTTVLGRPHVADAMIAAGAVRDRTQAFDDYLGLGKPAYVDRHAELLTDTIDAVASAGGVTVIAHPWGRHGPAGISLDDIAAMAARGLSGLEVDHQDHDAAVREQLRGIARDLDLVITGSSDHHGSGKVDHELGCNTTDPLEYERLLERAARAAAGARARPPAVVRPTGG